MSRPIQRHENTLVFRNLAMVTTWGYKYQEVDKDGKIITTPLCMFPADRIGAYMSHAEYQNLPAGAHALKSRVVVTPKGFGSGVVEFDIVGDVCCSRHCFNST